MADAKLDELLLGFRVAHDRDNRRVNGHVVRASLQSPLAGVDIAKLSTINVSLDNFIPSGSDTVDIPTGKPTSDSANIFKAADEKEMQKRFCSFLKEHYGLSLPNADEVKIPATPS